MSGSGGTLQDKNHWAVLVVSIAGSAALAVALGQDSGFDLFNYHYYSGFAFLHKPFGYDFAPAQIQSFHNPLMHMASYVALANLPARAAAALFGAVQGLNVYLLFLISLILFSNLKNPFRFILSLANAVAGFYGIASITELGSTYGDNLVSIPVLMGLLLILRRLKTGSLSGKKALVDLAAAGFLVGASLGLKLTAAAYGLAVLLSVPIIFWRDRSRAHITAALWCGFIIGFAAAYGFWGAKLYATYGNPFFPYLNGIFHSPYFEPSNFLDERFFPATRLQTLFYPFFFIQTNRLVSEAEFRDIRLALCYTAVILLAAAALARFAGRARKRDAFVPAGREDFCLVFLLTFFAISYMGWLHLSSIYRYLSVLELLAPAFLALTVSRFFKRESLVFWSSIVLNAAIIAAASPINFGRQEFRNDLLKIEVPQVRELDKSIILMAASPHQPIAYIIPSFPASTRFARISSSFSIPGKNTYIDRKILNILASYDNSHTLAFVPDGEEIGLTRMDASAYGKRVDARSCYEVHSGSDNRGYLCGMEGIPIDSRQKPVPEVGYFPQYAEAGSIRVGVRSEGKYVKFRIAGLSAKSLDVLYTFHGEMMPPVRNWLADSPGTLSLGPLSRAGEYRILGIRDSGSSDPDLWIRVDVDVRLDEP